MDVVEERVGNAIWSEELMIPGLQGLPEERRDDSVPIRPRPEWMSLRTGTYQCGVYLIPEESGGYSVFAFLLPGVVSQGETIQDALDNIAEAFRGVVEEYKASDMPIPWSRDVYPKPKDAIEQWILVNA